MSHIATHLIYLFLQRMNWTHGIPPGIRAKGIFTSIEYKFNAISSMHFQPLEVERNCNKRTNENRSLRRLLITSIPLRHNYKLLTHRST